MVKGDIEVDLPSDQKGASREERKFTGVHLKEEEGEHLGKRP